MNPVFIDQCELYSLGTLTKLVIAWNPVLGENGVIRIPDGVSDRWGHRLANVKREFFVKYFLDFEARRLKIGIPMDRGGFSEKRGDGTKIETLSFDYHLETSQGRFVDLSAQHPYFEGLPNIVLKTRGKSEKRYMLGDFGTVLQFDLSRLDQDVLERLKQLPPHVRNIAGI